jgi:pimeloyl-ACP methyl ester carboxylesterase
LHCKDEKGEFLADYYPGILPGDNAFTNVVRLDTSEYQPTEVQLINNAEGYAYLNQSDVSASKLVIKLTRTRPPVELPWDDEVRGFTINGNLLYGITADADEPPGIWKFDLLTRDTDNLVSSIEQPFKYATHAPVLEGYVTNAAGEQLTYYLLQPVKSLGNQKHPMVVGIMGLGELGNVWDRWAQGMANSGGYFVSMDRRKRSRDQWADDAFCAYEFLAKNFSVDTNNVYLLGVSAGAYTANTLLETEPDVWKGAFLFSMGSFPALDQRRVQAIVLDVGALDIGEGTNRLFQSQDQLAAAGIRPILMVHPNAGHIVRSIRLERERMEQIAAFIRQP